MTLKKTSIVVTLVLVSLGIFGFTYLKKKNSTIPATISQQSTDDHIDPLAWIANWTRPDGPAKVGLQVGHWKNSELPDELAKLRGNTGTSASGKSEWEVNLAIAEETKKILSQKNIEVDILPSTIPSQYWADVFVAIHADGNTDTSASGFKIASPRLDLSGNGSTLVEDISHSYAQETGLSVDPNITRNMTGYYAFSWWRYEHAVHPRTASAILETGFLTNAKDRQTIVNKPEISAQGLADGIIKYLTDKGLVNNEVSSLPGS